MVASRSEPVVILESIQGEGKYGKYGILKCRPVRDSEGLSMPIDYRCDPPHLADPKLEGNVVALDLLTTIRTFGSSAATQTGCVGVVPKS